LRFFLGTHRPNWLADVRFTNVPLFVSRRTLTAKRLPVACTDWALDSGGFTELNLHGGWKTTAAEYVASVRRYQDHVGRLAWAAPQDWMCEPVVLAKTGLTVEEHQMRTVQNFLELRTLAPDLPIAPVLQGWSLADYWRCEDLYGRYGVRLHDEPIVGVGTVCRRQGGADVANVLSSLAASGLRLHGFGVKAKGLALSASALASADSLAWSFNARRNPPLPGHDKPGGHKNCANCAEYAIAWRDRLLSGLEVKHAA